jgi:hypothetical protein
MGKRLQADLGLQEQVLVTPYDLLINFDVQVRDGSLPVSGQGELWLEMFRIISSNEALLQRFDIVRIFKHIARELGAKNVDNFEIQPVIQPDEVVQKQVAAGQLRPIGGIRG